MTVLIIIIAILSFATGFLLGLIKKYNPETNPPRKIQFSDEDLLKEYTNFLNYDGTEQNL